MPGPDDLAEAFSPDSPPSPSNPFSIRYGRAPLQCCGFAFGLTGASKLVAAVHDCSVLVGFGLGEQTWVKNLSTMFNVWAVLSLCILLPRYRRCDRLGRDLSSFDCVARLSIAPLVIGYLSGAVASLRNSYGGMVLHTGMVIQVQLMIRFLYMAWHQGKQVEPFWFPPTVGIAMGPAAALSFEHSPEMCNMWLAMFLAGVVLAVFLIPMCVRNLFGCCRVVSEVTAPNPTVFVMIAPAAFLGTICFSLIDYCPYLGIPRWCADVWVVVEVIMVILLAPCVYVRRGVLAQSPIHFWAAVTFPTASTANMLCLWFKSVWPVSRSIGMAVITFGCAAVLLISCINAWFWVRIVVPGYRSTAPRRLSQNGAPDFLSFPAGPELSPGTSGPQELAARS